MERKEAAGGAEGKPPARRKRPVAAAAVAGGAQKRRPVAVGDVGYTFRKKLGDAWYEGRVVEVLQGARGGKDRRCVYSEVLSLSEVRALGEHTAVEDAALGGGAGTRDIAAVLWTGGETGGPPREGTRKTQKDRWRDQFALLQSYINEHGHCKMSQKYTVNGINLGSWADRQRTSFKKGKLSEERWRLLNSIGFQFE